jgi:hypothetical protein
VGTASKVAFMAMGSSPTRPPEIPRIFAPVPYFVKFLPVQQSPSPPLPPFNDGRFAAFEGGRE